MNTLHRYILKESALYFAITLIAFTGILLTVRMLKFTSLIVNKGVALSQIVEVFISIVPTFLELAIPMATMLGVLMAFARLSGDSELIVMRGSGISLYQLIAPVLLLGVFSTAIGFAVSLKLKPWGAQNLSRTLFEIARSKSTSGLTEGIFNPLGDLTLYAQKIDFSLGQLDKVLIDDQRPGQLRRIIFSQTGELTSDSESQILILRLYNGKIHEVTEKGRYVVTSFRENQLSIPLAEIESDSKKSGPSPREMSIPELESTITLLEQHLTELEQLGQKSGDSTPFLQNILAKEDSSMLSNSYLKHLIENKPPNELKRRYLKLNSELATRWSMPWASLILAIVALPLGVVPPRTQRTWGAGLSLMLGLSVFLIYYGGLMIGISLSESGALNHTLGTWIPNFSVLIIGILLIRTIGSERAASVADILLRLKPNFSIFRRGNRSPMATL